LLLSLRAMLHLELPHINVLSKIDLLTQYGDLGILPILSQTNTKNYLKTSYFLFNKQTSI
jgi:GPN-loop GTPase